MLQKLEVELMVILCSCFTGILCSELMTAKVLSPMVLYGSILGIAFALFVMSVFISISVRKPPISITEDDRVYYGFMSLIAFIALILFVVYEVTPIYCWVVACTIWLFTSMLRLVFVWN